MFEILRGMRPYFFSFRDVNKIIALDILIPDTWKYEQIITLYEGVNLKLQGEENGKRLISLLIKNYKYETLFDCAGEIIRINKENERKQELLNQKIAELDNNYKKQINDLKKMFENQPLTVLESKTETILDGEPHIPTETGDTGEGKEERRDDSPEREGENDKTNENVGQKQNV